MFYTKFRHLFYKSALSERRFTFLIRCLHFDDAAIGAQTKVYNKFGLVGTIWNNFIRDCTDNYITAAGI